MKKIIFLLVFILMAGKVGAEFTIFSDKNSKEIIFIQEKGEEVVLSESDKIKIEETVMSGSLSDYALQYDFQDYKFKNGNFIINTKKISDRENKKEKDNLISQDMMLINMRALKIACDSLIADGVVFQEIKCGDFE